MSTNYQFKPKKGSIKKKNRKARGNASGKGGESGRGHKGQKSRSGYSYRAGFEGGQMPLYKRLPKLRGLGNLKISNSILIVNLSFINNKFNEKDIVDMESLKAKGLYARNSIIKILGNGNLEKSLTIKAHLISNTALEKIKAANCTFEKI